MHSFIRYRIAHCYFFPPPSHSIFFTSSCYIFFPMVHYRPRSYQICTFTHQNISNMHIYSPKYIKYVHSRTKKVSECTNPRGNRV